MLLVFNGHAILFLIPVAIVFGLVAFHKFPPIATPPRELSLKAFLTPFLKCKKPLLLLYFSQVGVQIVAASFMFLLPDLLHAKGCHSWLCMGGGHCCFILGSAAAMLPAGYLADRFGQRPVLLASFLIGTFLFYTFLFSKELSLIEAGLFLGALGASLMVANPLIISFGNRLVPESPSTVSALLMGFAWCVGNLGPLCAGALTPHFPNEPIGTTLSFMGLSLIVCFTLILFTPRKEGVKQLSPT